MEGGEEATITVDVTNIGAQTGSYTAVLTINGVTRGTKEVTLGSEQSQQIAFTVSENEPGSYVVQVGDLDGEFLSFLWINWWLGGGIAAAIIFIGWLVWYLIRRQRFKATIILA